MMSPLRRANFSKMKIYKGVSAPVTQPAHFEFYNYATDNLVRVENRTDGIVVRSMHDNLSEAAKAAAIRQWALEGFISDIYSWLTEDALKHASILWLVDRSWITPMWKLKRLISRFGRPLVATSFMIFLLGLMLYFGLKLPELSSPVWGRRFGAPPRASVLESALVQASEPTQSH